MLKFISNNLIMKKETGILLAGSMGIIIGLGIFGLKKFLSKRKNAYHDYYSDFHRHFERESDEGNHGIEFFAVQ